MKKRNILWILSFLFVFLNSCNLIEPVEEEKETDDEIKQSLGFDDEEEEKVYGSIPKELSFITLGEGTVSPGTSALLTDWMPPIGDQGQYGTCTSWATGYYTRTIAHARENKLTADQLKDNTNVYSPLDIYLSISHGADCGGSSIAEAFSVMQSRGIAKFSDVPYQNLGNCSQSSSASSNQYETGKIDHYRKVEVTSKDELKAQLSLGRPIAVGCKLGPNFFSYKDGVFMDEDYSEWDAAGKHAGHAMCVVGFDDEKGPNGAFLIVNSWGDWWGDKGFVWVDQDFFTGGVFCKYGYVIESDKGEEPIIDKNVIDPNQRVDGKDLLTIQLEDRQGDKTEDKPNPGSRDRSVEYNVLNKGNQTIAASNDWNIIYYFYNATNPEADFGIVFFDYYTDDVAGQAQKGEFGDFADVNIDVKKFGQWNWWNYIDVEPGLSVGRALDGTSESNMVFDYELPDTLNGEYYFVLYADGFNSLTEQYEQNNYMFFTGADKKPIKITKGVVDQSNLKSSNAFASVYSNELRKAQPNTYSIDEISNLIKYQKKAGILEAKAKEYKNLLKSGGVIKAKKRLIHTNSI